MCRRGSEYVVRVPELRYVDHQPGVWFLVTAEAALYLDARYSYSAVIDASALIRLDDAELDRYRGDGRAFLSELAERIHDSAPYRPESPYRPRDLYRGQDAATWRRAVADAIDGHTWLAEQRRAETRVPGGSAD